MLAAGGVPGRSEFDFGWQPPLDGARPEGHRQGRPRMSSRFELIPTAALFALALGWVAGCEPAASACPDDDPTCDPASLAYEGDVPGECGDGVDNDGDGAVDCDDTDCAASPACDTGSSTLPPILPDDWQMVGAGDFHTCAIAPDLQAFCWGWNFHEQASPPAGTFSWVGAGWSHSCALTTDNTLTCWGTDTANDFGQSEPPEGEYAQLAVGGHHNCVLNDAGEAESCWGRSEHGQLDVPDRSWNLLDGGTFSTCGLDTEGQLACWGESDTGKLDPPSGTWETFGMGESSACALEADGQAQCWGNPNDGLNAPPDTGFKQISCGSLHCCGIALDGLLACWGSDLLQDGSWAGQATPPEF